MVEIVRTMSSVPHFLANLGLKPVANVEELIVKMLDGRVGMVGVNGRRVERVNRGARKFES